MKQINVFIGAFVLLWLTTFVHASTPIPDHELLGMGLVIVYELAPGSSNKEGLQALSDMGSQVFAASNLNSRNGGVSSLGGSTGATLPRWVRVTWRAGVDKARGQYWTTGRVVGDFTVPVLERIPSETINYAGARPGRAIVLRFRLKDDGVLLAWDVQESSANGQGWEYKMHGGDFLDPTIENGKVIDPGWQK